MNNFVSVLLATIGHLGGLTKDEYLTLTKKIHSVTLPDNPEAAWTQVEEMFKDIDIKKLEEKLKLVDKKK